MKPVWDKPNPEKHSEKLSPSQKAKAKARAARAGRPYPNMVDNIWAARNEEMNNPYTEMLEQLADMCNVCGQTPCNCTHISEAKATMCGRCGTKHVAPKFGGTCPALKEDVALDEATENLPGKATHLTNKDVRHPEHGIISGSTTLRHLGGNNYEVRAGRAKGKTISLDKQHVQKLSEERINEISVDAQSKYFRAAERSKSAAKGSAEYARKALRNPEKAAEHEKIVAKREKGISMYTARYNERNPRPKITPQPAGSPYKPLGGYDRNSGRSYNESVQIDEFLPAVMAALGRGAGAAGRIASVLGGIGSIAGGVASGVGSAVGGAASGIGSAVGGIAKGVGSAVGGVANAVSSNDNDAKKKKNTTSNLEAIGVAEALSARARLAIALDKQRDRRELKQQARDAREAAAKPSTFAVYTNSKGNKNEKTN